MLSLCVIAKDAELDLAGCIRSCLGLVDEVVVVDTGSTDASREVARRLGAVLLETPFTDFATVRNWAIRHCATEWILVLDTDERLAPIAQTQLREWCKSSQYDVYRLWRYDYKLHGGWNLFALPRLFRAGTVRYVNQVGETLEGGDRSRYSPPSPCCSAQIHHFGYCRSKVTIEHKARRYISKLQHVCEGAKPNDYIFLFAARVCLEMDEVDGALRNLSLAERNAVSPRRRADIAAFCGRIFEMTGSTDRASKHYEKSLDLLDKSDDRHVMERIERLTLRARLLACQGDPNKALQLYEDALALCKIPHLMVNAAMIREGMGRFAEAQHLYEQAVETNEVIAGIGSDPVHAAKYPYCVTDPGLGAVAERIRRCSASVRSGCSVG